MKKVFLLFTFLLLSISITSVFSQNKKNTDRILANSSPEDFVLNNASLGTDFWVAIPQNDVLNSGLKPRGVEVVITSPYNTEITLEIPEVGYTRTKKVEAFKQVSFSSEDNDVTYAMEVTTSEAISRKGLHLFADKPFAAWVINSKQYSSEGYMAIPTANLGKEYRYVGFYDNYTNTWGDRNKERGAGFIIIATEQGTNVAIDLMGTNLAGETVMGKKPGDKISVKLNAGDTYMVRGDGKTSGQFDLSGTKITTSKPVAVVSFHMRTMIPCISPQDSDNLMEMLAPITAWGKTFYTIQFDRKPTGSRKGKGDLFRMVNNEANTNLTCEFFDIATYSKEGTRNLPFNKAGMFGELDPIGDINNSNEKTSIFGMASWSTDKPIILMQNSFSNRWDGDLKWSPLNILIPPVEQYVRSFMFTTPIETGFQEHQLTLIVEGDPSDPESELLRSVKLDGEDLWRSYPGIVQNRIPNSNYYWIRLNVETGAHYLQSNTLMYGYVTGFDAYNAYGYPAVHGFNIVDNMDSASPKVSRTMSCGNYDLVATEITNGGNLDDPKQVDAGISQILLIEGVSSNYNLTIKNPDLFKPQNKISRWEFYLDLIDNLKPGKAVYAVMDRAGNIFMDSVSYDPPKVGVDPQMIEFGAISLSKDTTYQICIKNESNDDYLVESISNLNPKYVLSGLPTLPITLKYQDSVLIIVTYTPTFQNPETMDVDTVYVSSDCLNLKSVLTGSVIYPTITVDKGFDFEKVLKGEQACMEEMNNDGLKITNTGTDDLMVYSINGISAPFLITSPTVPKLPITIEPDSTISLKSICFIPQDTVKSELTFTVMSNAVEGDSTCSIIGEGYIEQIDTTSVEDEGIGLSMKISPNPAEDNFTISWENISNHSISIDIVNIQGLVVETIKPDTYNETGFVEYSSKNLAPGLYLVRMTNQIGSISRKLVILK